MQKSLRNAEIIPVGVGYYTAPEAARLLKTSPRLISRWLGGYSYKSVDGAPAQAPPLWRPQLPRLGATLEIGFRDLIELRFVLAFLRHDIGLNVIRRCLENARKIVDEERPFSTQKFRTDGKSIFLESIAELRGSERAPSLRRSQGQPDGLQAGDRTHIPRSRPRRRLGCPMASLPRKTVDRRRPRPFIRQATGRRLRCADCGPGSSREIRRIGATRGDFSEVPVAVVNDAVAFEQSLMAA